jgi:hypothetical protein
MRIDLIPTEPDYEMLEHACFEGNRNFDYLAGLKDEGVK